MHLITFVFKWYEPPDCGMGYLYYGGIGNNRPILITKEKPLDLAFL